MRVLRVAPVVLVVAATSDLAPLQPSAHLLVPLLALGLLAGTLVSGLVLDRVGGAAPAVHVLACGLAGAAISLVAAPVVGLVSLVLSLSAVVAAACWPAWPVRQGGSPVRPRFADRVDTGGRGGRVRPLDARQGAALRRLTTEQLGELWEQTHAGLGLAREARALSAVADLRRAVLDEFERRMPGRFASWLAGAPSAQGNPSSHITRSQGD